MSKFYNIDLTQFPYKKETYTGKFGPFDYLVVPWKEYNWELVEKVHDMPLLLSEWRQFYAVRFEMVNGFGDYNLLHHRPIPDFINLPIITRQECWECGL